VATGVSPVVHAGETLASSEGNEMSMGTIVILAASLLLLVYLAVALLRPEKF
jgi:K+-transporting ATPase KdpF subunit